MFEENTKQDTVGSQLHATLFTQVAMFNIANGTGLVYVGHVHKLVQLSEAIGLR